MIDPGPTIATTKPHESSFRFYNCAEICMIVEWANDRLPCYRTFLYDFTKPKCLFTGLAKTDRAEYFMACNIDHKQRYKMICRTCLGLESTVWKYNFWRQILLCSVYKMSHLLNPSETPGSTMTACSCPAKLGGKVERPEWLRERAFTKVRTHGRSESECTTVLEGKVTHQAKRSSPSPATATLILEVYALQTAWRIYALLRVCLWAWIPRDKVWLIWVFWQIFAHIEGYWVCSNQ